MLAAVPDTSISGNRAELTTLIERRGKPSGVTDYNTERPHSSLGYKTPLTYATLLTATDRRATQDESSAHRPVAHTTPTGRDSNRCWMKVQWQLA